MRIRATAVAFAIGAISYAVVATSASALEPGVYVSPGSPAGKEYALPLPAARGQGAGQPVNPSGTEPLFGVGISPGTTGRGSTGAAKAGGHGSGRLSRGHHQQRSASSPAAPAAGGRNQVSRQEFADLTHQGSAVPQVALWGGLVVLGGLAIGGLLAFLARRRSL